MRHVSGYKSFLFDMRYYGSTQTQKHKGNMQQDADQELLGCPPTLVYHFPNPNIHVAKAGFKHFFFSQNKNQNINANSKKCALKKKKKTGYLKKTKQGKKNIAYQRQQQGHTCCQVDIPASFSTGADVGAP